MQFAGKFGKVPVMLVQVLPPLLERYTLLPDA